MLFQLPVQPFAEQQLRDAIAVAQVDKGYSAKLSDGLYPAGKRYCFSCIIYI